MRSGKAALVFLGLIAVAAGLVHVAAPVSPFDDAFITFRYVDNLLGGKGLVYNPGERVFGISSPLYAAWLAMDGAALPSIPLPSLAVRGNLVFLLAAAALAHLLLRRLGFSATMSALAAGGVLVSEGILRASLGGMESPMFLALAFGSLLASAGGRDTAAVTLASLSALARPEGLILLLVVAAPALRARGRRRFPWSLLGILPLLAWLGAAGFYYGSVIPESVIAKARPLYPFPAGAAFGHLASQMGRWTFDAASAAAGRQPPRILYQTAGLALTAWALWRWRRTPDGNSARARALALPAWLLLTVVFYALTNPLLLPWYIPLIQAPWIVVVLAATGGPRRNLASRLFSRAAAALILSTALASFVYAVIPSGRSLLRYGATDQRQSGQMAAYVRTSLWLRQNTGPDESIAAAEIGVLGYQLPRRILDACGLVTPGALPFIPVPPDQRGSQLGSFSVQFVRAARPDLVVFLPAFAERSLLRSDWFASEYALVHEEEFLPDEPRFRAVQVFRKRRAVVGYGRMRP